MDIAFLLENTQAKIECLCAHDDYLYVGTSDGHVFLYEVEAQQSGITGEITYAYTELVKKNLGHGKKPVTDIQVDPVLKRVFILYDTFVDMYDMFTLDHITRIKESKGANTFAVDKSYSTHRLGIAVKKKIILVRYTEMECKFYQELAIPDQAFCMEWKDSTICVGYKREYTMLHCRTGETSELFPIEKTMPLIKNMDSEVILRLGNVGVFVGITGDRRGTPTRSSVNWSETPNAVGLCFPYVAGVLAKSIEIYNLYDQTLAQTISFQNGFTAAGTKKRAYVASQRDIHILTPIPYEKQITNLIDDMRIIEAFDLFEKIFEGTAEQKEQKIKRMHEDAGFACFFATRFNEAFEHFAESSIDIREILAYFEDLQPPKKRYKSTTRPIRGEIKSRIIEYLEKRDMLEGKDPNTLAAMYVKQAKKWLKTCLEQRRDTKINRPGQAGYDEQVAIDYALLCIYLEFKNHQQIEKMLRSSDNNCELESCAELFESKKCYKFLAYLYRSKGHLQEALEILKKLGEGTYVEPEQNGIAETIEFLCEISDKNLIWKYGRWVFEKEPEKAIQIFTSKVRATPLAPDQVLQYLSPYPDDITQKYLEFLVIDEKSDEGRYHTQLALNYIETLLALKPVTTKVVHGVRVKAGSEAGLLGVLRTKLLTHLEQSNLYKVSTILAQLKGTDLYEEMVILHCKSKEHEEALKILVWDLVDLKGAERYCITIHAKEQQQLQQQLLEQQRQQQQQREQQQQQMAQQAGLPYLPELGSARQSQRASMSAAGASGGHGGSGANNMAALLAPASVILGQMEPNPLLILLLKICFYPTDNRPQNIDFALHILNTRAKEMNPVHAIKLIPNWIPLSQIQVFLTQSIQSTIHQRREGAVDKNLAKMENLQMSSKLSKCTSVYVTITNDSICPVCNKKIGDSVFAVYPNRTIVHFRCFKSKSVCPVTGIDFVKFPADIPE